MDNKHTPRQLNVEIIRIFAMLLICFWHIHGHYMDEVMSLNDAANTIITYICLFISFHVNLFVMISGYFGIKKRTKGIVNSIFICVFYALLINIVVKILGGSFSIQEILMPLSHSPWWFMMVYICMILVAPIIETYILHVSEKQFYYLLFIATLFNVYLGFFHQNPKFYQYGYDLYNFINVYLIGVWIRKNIGIIKYLTNCKWVPIVLFVICCAVRYKVQPITSVTWTDYNSPLNLLMAISVFCLFTQVKVNYRLAKPITFLSSSAVSVYLLTDHQSLVPYVRPMFTRIYISCNGISEILLMIITLIIAVYLFCCLIDKARIFLSRICLPPIVRILDSVL